MAIEVPRYIRFGEVLKGGRSKNHKMKVAEKGLSAYEGSLVAPGLFEIDTSRLRIHVGLGTLLHFAASDARAYFVEGEEVARGWDGEPLLKATSFEGVPGYVALTATEASVQPALSRWSEGPRDSKTDNRCAQCRLLDDERYFPPAASLLAPYHPRMDVPYPPDSP